MKKLTIIGIFIPVVIIACGIAIITGFWLNEKFITSDDPKDFKYPVSDLMYSKYVDASHLIESGEFLPIYCEGRIDKLIRSNPLIIGKDKENGI